MMIAERVIPLVGSSTDGDTHTLYIGETMRLSCHIAAVLNEVADKGSHQCSY
jgi:hypothetical protein